MKESKDKNRKGRLISLNPGQKIVITPTRVVCINTTGQKGGAGKLRGSEDRVNSTQCRRPSETKEDKQAKDYSHRSGQVIDPAGSGGAGDSRKLRIEVSKAGPTKVAIVLLGIRDSNPESGKVILQVDISSRTK